jgi:hypothetical protein
MLLDWLGKNQQLMVIPLSHHAHSIKRRSNFSSSIASKEAVPFVPIFSLHAPVTALTASGFFSKHEIRSLQLPAQ